MSLTKEKCYNIDQASNSMDNSAYKKIPYILWPTLPAFHAWLYSSYIATYLYTDIPLIKASFTSNSVVTRSNSDGSAADHDTSLQALFEPCKGTAFVESPLYPHIHLAGIKNPFEHRIILPTSLIAVSR